MIRGPVAAALCALAHQLGSLADGTAWYLFGSTACERSVAADIDVLILCRDAGQADQLRAAIDIDALKLPLDLSLMTFDEERESGAVARQRARIIFSKMSVEV